MAAAAIPIGAAVIGGLISSNASKKAAEAQAGAAQHASDIQWNMYQTTRQDQAPWRAAGQAGLGQLAWLLGVKPEGDYFKGQNYNPKDFGAFNHAFGAADFKVDPGFQFRLDEGNKALQRSAAARGSLYSGGPLKALDRYSQGLASQEYDSAYNRFMNDRSQRFNQLASLAGLGQTANGQIAQVGMNAANNIGQNVLGAGSAAAA